MRWIGGWTLARVRAAALGARGWVNEPALYNDEMVLQTPLQWQMEQEARLMGLDDDEFEAVERKALRQDDAVHHKMRTIQSCGGHRSYSVFQG